MALPINLNATVMLDLQVSVMSRADSNIYPEDECNGLQDEYSTTLHLIAALVVLVASVVGTIIPILGKHFPALRLPDYVYAVGKSSATGVMLAVGFIHLLFDSAEKFNVSCFPQGFKEMYEPWPFMFAMAAAILMQGIDYLIMEISRGWMEQRQLLEGGAANNASCPEGTEGNPPAIEGSTHSGDESSTDNAKLAVNPISEVVEVDVDASSPIAGCHTHQHGVAAPQHGSQLQRTVAALCMEFGVTLHSVFVGLDLGVLGDDKTKVLLAALIFHQLFEGLAMGARLADAPFGLTLELVLMMVFSLSAPLGTVGATIAMSVSRDALAGATYVVVSVVLNSMCAGILIYLGFGLLYMDFPADLKRVCPPGMKYRHRKILGMFLGLWLGAGLMGFIGKWC